MIEAKSKAKRWVVMALLAGATCVIAFGWGVALGDEAETGAKAIDEKQTAADFLKERDASREGDRSTNKTRLRAMIGTR